MSPLLKLVHTMVVRLSLGILSLGTLSTCVADGQSPSRRPNA